MAPKKQIEQNELMIVNDSPGEECRIAILQDGHLEELFTERTATATDVGNIYKGRVMNVEPAIQAAFIDYGQGVNGFLHISDLHPKYFPGEERTERVGKKIPRRDRPPIQHALKRGQEILVQVLKEGIGTKGPTLTSYLSIPGRLLVLMPDMDRVGVSRKVEDEEKRREMRQILDSLNLPDGFGFILRTAGYGQSKTELKRDAAYLLRLWKMMEKRIKSQKAPCELYTESDLLIRTVRDVLRPSIKTIIVDSPSAFDRASMFLRVVSPRSAPQVVRYRRPGPIFHAFDIERQIELIHSREVPLPSGGRLVIDQTEALVAIDVNSGRSRSARDSETNAYETNVEAADEICRQLRLRDLGGLIVNDLIDMRFTKHRKAIEEQFQNNLKRDRAKATILPISDFGIMEMTRQRMRPSIRKSHFMACAHCNGRGEIKSPEYVAADAARHIGYLLQSERVKRVEVACSSRVGSVLLSGKRRELVRLEDLTGKRIDVRVTDGLAVDRVDYYAYDDRNADIDIAKLPPLKPPTVEDLVSESQAADVMESAARVGQHGFAAGSAGVDHVDDGIAMAGDYGDAFDDFQEENGVGDGNFTDESAVPAVAGAAQADSEQHGRGSRRRRRRRGGAHQDSKDVEKQIEPSAAAASTDGAEHSDAAAPLHADHAAGQQPPGGKRRRRRGGRRHRHRDQSGLDTGATAPADAATHPNDEAPVRIHNLARELSVTSKELIERSEAEPAIHHLANALSTVSAEEAQVIRELFSNGEQIVGDVEAPRQMTDAKESAPSGTPLVIADEARGGRRKRRRRGRRRGRDGQQGESGDGQPHRDEQSAGAGDSADAPSTQHSPSQPSQGDSNANGGTGGRRSRRKRRGRRGGGDSGGRAEANGSVGPATQSQTSSAPVTVQSPPTASGQTRKPRRSLYRAGRVSVSPAAREASAVDE